VFFKKTIKELFGMNLAFSEFSGMVFPPKYFKDKFFPKIDKLNEFQVSMVFLSNEDQSWFFHQERDIGHLKSWI